MGEPAIQIEHLRKSYGATVAVAGISLEAGRGEIVGLIGPDGAGKTTTMRISCGLLHPDEGRVTVMGFDTITQARALKHHLGYMPQRFSLYPDLTVEENLHFFAELFGVRGEERRQQEDRLLRFSRLAPFRNRRASMLSGGMKQKLALACTLIHTPEVLVLDEPTTGVDPVSRQEFWGILRELASQDMALLVSTPYMDEANLCDRVALMDRGRVIASGTPAEITRDFPRRLLEIAGPGHLTARERLNALAIEGLGVHRFGDRLHVVHDSEAQEQRIREAVADLDLRLQPIEPSIEDTFVELMDTQGTVQP